MRAFAVLPTLALLAPLTAHAQLLQADDFAIEASAAGESHAEYLGSDTYEFGFKPQFQVTWQRGLFLSSENGLGVYLVNTMDDLPNHTTVAMSVMRDGGRDASDFAALTGVEDVQSTLYARFMGEYTTGLVTIGGQLRQSFTNDRGDRTATLYLGLKDEIMPGLTASLTGGVTWASQEYMKRYFGINAAEALASGYAQHDVEDGFRDVTLSTGLSYAIGDSGFTLDGRVKWTMLLGDAADSPLTKDENQFGMTMGVAYHYN